MVVVDVVEAVSVYENIISLTTLQQHSFSVWGVQIGADQNVVDDVEVVVSEIVVVDEVANVVVGVVYNNVVFVDTWMTRWYFGNVVFVEIAL